MGWITRHTRLRYIILLSIGAAVMTAAFVWNGVLLKERLSLYVVQLQRDMQDAINTEAQGTFARVRDDLRFLQSMTTQKLSLLKFEYDPLYLWMQEVVTNFTETRPYIAMIGVYNEANVLALTIPRSADESSAYRQRRPPTTVSDCLQYLAQPDGFCDHHGVVSMRISVPVTDRMMRPRGRIIAVVEIRTGEFLRIEQKYRMELSVAFRGHFIYQSPRIAAVAAHPLLMLSNGRVVMVSKRVWIEDMLSLGTSPDDLRISVFRTARGLIIDTLQATMFIFAVGLSYFLLVQYFAMNYKSISAGYRGIFDALPDMICLTDETGRIRYINQSMANQIFHTTPRTVVLRRHHPSSELYQKLWESERIVRNTQATHLADMAFNGRALSVLHVPIMHDDILRGVVTCVRDLTLLQEIRQDVEHWKHSAQSSQQILGEIFEHSPDWLCIFDADGQIVSAGKQMQLDLRQDFGALRDDLLDAAQHIQERFTWTVSVHGVQRTFTASCLRVQDAPERFLLIANDVTVHASWQEELESVVTMVTHHIMRQNQRQTLRTKTDRLHTEDASANE